MVNFSFLELSKIAVYSWGIQSLSLAVAFLLLIAEQQTIGDQLLRGSFYADIVVFVLMILWSILEFTKTTEDSPSHFGLYLILIGSVVFITAAISYRTILDYFPPNPISDFFIPLYKLDTSNSGNTIDFSDIGNIVNGILIANIGIFMVVFGFVTFTIRKSAKIGIVLYGILNIFLTFSIFLIPLKTIVSFPFLALFILKLYDDS